MTSALGVSFRAQKKFYNTGTEVGDRKIVSSGEKVFRGLKKNQEKCDQMARLFGQYLAI